MIGLDIGSKTIKIVELEKDHDLLYVEYLKAKDNFNFKEGDEL